MPRDPGFDAGDEESSVLLGESDRRAEWREGGGIGCRRRRYTMSVCSIRLNWALRVVKDVYYSTKGDIDHLTN